MNGSLISLEQYLDKFNFEWAIQELHLVKFKRMAGLNKGSKASRGKGVGNHYTCADSALNELANNLEVNREQYNISNKQRKIDFYTIDIMLTAFIYIAQAKPYYDENGGCYLTVTTLIFDINNKKDIYSVATHNACVYRIFKRYFMEDLKFKLKVGVVSLDEEASNLVQAEAEKVVRDPRSKDTRSNRLENTLETWGITPSERDHIQIKYANMI